MWLYLDPIDFNSFGLVKLIWGTYYLLAIMNNNNLTTLNGNKGPLFTVIKVVAASEVATS